MSDQEMSRQNVPSEVLQHINAKNAKVIAVTLVVGFILYHAIIHLVYGIDSCKWLLSDGRFQGYHVWQPYGCMMHTYNEMDSRMCFRYIDYLGGRNHIVFVGDSRTRELYLTLVRHLNPNPKDNEYNRHSNLKYTDDHLKLTVEFLWQPVVNQSMLDVCDSWLKLPLDQRPSLVVMGSATWSIKTSNGSLEALEAYRDGLLRLIHPINRMQSKTKVLFMLQDPVLPDRMKKERQLITNELIDLYNKVAMDALKDSAVHIWSSSRLVSQGYNLDSEDGLHIGKIALNSDTQILLNLYCNDPMNYNDGTCCSRAEPITTLQIISLSSLGILYDFIARKIVFFSVLVAFLMILHKRKLKKNVRRSQTVNCINNSSVETKSWYELTTSLARLGIIMGYFFLCDRTNFFMKENKYYTHLNFFLPFAYVFALGLFFTEETQLTKVLHRDQTNEWKGWMQLVILIYHMTGASQVLPIYMNIRVLVSAYLFLSGYGHFSYFWHKSDTSVLRLFQVLFRVNLLVVVLCLCMNRPYQFYYFVPLISFWFLVIYTTMAFIPRVTSASAEANPLQNLYVVLKFVVLFSIVTILFISEVFFEKIFVTRPWKAFFVTEDDSIREWWFRWKIDRYSTASGMLFAFAYHLLKQYRILEDSNHSNLFSRNLAFMATFLSLVGVLGYSVFAKLCRNKTECNEVHPYVSFVPIVSYIILRNISGLLRTRYSTFFAWFGKISLELFICQYHIWLAADTHGMLVLVPSYPVLNIMVTSFIFICAAHDIHEVTLKLVKYATPSDWRYLVRNMTIFFLILIPIGIHDGMF
uniref:Cas1p 10 TM acyl transferase domain-containing protein n=1 Tax=Strigamia maritima TaxID=126957 RepID=T1INP0_STRMM